MARPLSTTAKHRREYVILTVDPNTGNCRFFIRDGYKSLLLSEYTSMFPFHHIKIYVLSSAVIREFK